MRKKQLVYLLVFLVSAVFMQYVVFKSRTHEPNKKRREYAPYVQAKHQLSIISEDVKDAMVIVKYPKEAVDAVHLTTNKNYRENVQPYLQGLNGDLNLEEFKSHDEKRYAMFKEIDREKRNCTVINIGIGRDIVETAWQMKQLLPNCQFHAVDAMAEGKDLYSEIGLYYQMFISGSGGVQRIRVPSVNYNAMKLNTTSVDDLLDNYIGQEYIDHLWIDAEGQEYGILEVILNFDQDIRPKHTICQLHIELHQPYTKFEPDRNKVMHVLRTLILYSTYIPIHTDHTTNSLKLFLINLRSNYCIQRFKY